MFWKVLLFSMDIYCIRLQSWLKYISSNVVMYHCYQILNNNLQMKYKFQTYLTSPKKCSTPKSNFFVIKNNFSHGLEFTFFLSFYLWFISKIRFGNLRTLTILKLKIHINIMCEVWNKSNWITRNNNDINF